MTSASIGLAILCAIAAPGETEHRIPVAEGISIQATLALPEGAVSHAVLLLPVAGPTDRDLSLGARGIYRAVADRLLRIGIATLRIADRGVDGSDGDWREADLETRISDAERAFRWLTERPELDGASIGVLGLSEGGGIALAVAGRQPRAEFLVMLSTPLGDGPTLLRDQRDRLLAGSALAEEQRALVAAESDRLLAAVAASDTAGARAVLEGSAGMLVLPPYGFVPREPETRVAFVMSPWYRSQVEYDLERLGGEPRTPVFLAYGGLDAVIDGTAHAERARSLADGEADRVRFLEEANHLLMPAVTGSPLEYATLPDLLHLELWEEIGAWIRDR